MKPILFNTEMVKAILEGQKTQTRRLNGLKEINKNPDDWKLKGFNRECTKVIFQNLHYPERTQEIKLPYGGFGDIMWVRETFKFIGQTEDGENHAAYKDGTEREIDYNPEKEQYWIEKCEAIIELMDKKGKLVFDEENEWCTWDKKDQPWQPSIHMPKEVSRIKLNNHLVSLQRLQDITENDAIAEGVYSYKNDYGNIAYKNYFFDLDFHSAIDSFRSLWVSVYGEESWASNPWVFVYNFKKQ